MSEVWWATEDQPTPAVISTVARADPSADLMYKGLQKLSKAVLDDGGIQHHLDVPARIGPEG